MHTIPLREFQREGTKSLQALKALGPSNSAQPVLLSGREQDYLLLPIPEEDRSGLMDLVEGLSAVLALRQGQRRAAAIGLDAMSAEDIDNEIRAARKARKRKPKSA